MKTIGEVISLSSRYLEEKGMDRSRRTTEELLSHVLKLKKMDLYLQHDKPIVESELESLRQLLKRCGKGEPLAYLLGEVEFLGCRIRVDRRVLIPRPETEILAEMIAKRAQKGVLWDICTGSGCLGIALKRACPDLQVTLSDLSPEALALAAENAQLNGVDVAFAEGDLFAPFKGKKADFLVCNPPYISQNEYFTLDAAVRDYEPQLALVGGERGTEFYERLAREWEAFADHLFLEIGAGQGERVKQIFGGKGEIHKDWAGHSRFFFLEKQ